jgi:putative sterol carrier protein
MARYLSDEWLVEVDRALGENESLLEASRGVLLTVQHTVTGGPDGDRAFVVVLDDGNVSVEGGPSKSADVTFTQSYDTASRIARNELSAQGAFLLGKLRVGGDLQKLTAHEKPLHDIDDVLADVRSSTQF